VIRALILIFILLAVAAFFTRPDARAAESALREQLLMAVAREDIGAGRGAAGNIALLTCKIRPSECYDLLRSQIEARFTDNYLFTRFEVQGFGKQARCIGAFTTFLCPGGLRDQD
jgi:hypothetical protein